MDLMKSMMIAASGLKAQSGRMRVIAENLANANSTAKTPGGDPYRRKIPTFQAEFDRALDAQVVSLGRIAEDTSDFSTRYDPQSPGGEQNRIRQNAKCEYTD